MPKVEHTEDKALALISALSVKVNDIENSAIKLEYSMAELTPSSDLEAVKRAVNQIIKLLNTSRD